MQNSLFQPRVVICVPSGVTEVEKKWKRQSMLVQECLLNRGTDGAAIGQAQLEPTGSMIVDIGRYNEVAGISLGGIVTVNL